MAVVKSELRSYNWAPAALFGSAKAAVTIQHKVQPHDCPLNKFLQLHRHRYQVLKYRREPGTGLSRKGQKRTTGKLSMHGQKRSVGKLSNIFIFKPKSTSKIN